MVNIYFVDTSALVKRYVTEIGSNWMKMLTDPASENKIILSRIAWVELISAFARLQREGKVNPDDVDTNIQALRYDWETQYQIVEVDKELIETAGDLVQQYPLRAYDSVQLASALKLFPVFEKTAPNAFTFISADDRLLSVANVEGLRIDNPNLHP